MAWREREKLSLEMAFGNTARFYARYIYAICDNVVCMRLLTLVLEIFFPPIFLASSYRADLRFFNVEKGVFFFFSNETYLRYRGSNL